jgi:hypothetical protein
MTLAIVILVALILIIAAYFVGENRGQRAVAFERAKLNAYREQLQGYLNHFGDRIGEEAKKHFAEFLALLKAKLGDK